jgi:hypothetical protein
VSGRVSAADDLLAHGQDVVAGVLRENAGRWETLSATDRARVEGLVRDIAERLLQEPALLLDAAERTGDAVRVGLARDLLGMSRPTASTPSSSLCAS